MGRGLTTPPIILWQMLGYASGAVIESCHLAFFFEGFDFFLVDVVDAAGVAGVLEFVA